jgi:hypothetical protein
MYASITRLELKHEDSIGAAVDALDGLLADARGVAGSRDCYVVRTGPRELTMVTIYDSEARRVRNSVARICREILDAGRAVDDPRL